MKREQNKTLKNSSNHHHEVKTENKEVLSSLGGFFIKVQKKKG